RGARDIDFALWGSFNPCGIATLVFPHLGWISFGAVFIGVVPLSMVLFIKKNAMNRQLKFALFLFVCSILFALGRYSPVYKLILNASGFYGFRVPAKFLFFAGFSLSVMAAYGISSLVGRGAEKLFLKRRFYIWVMAVILIIALLTAADVALKHKEFWLEKGREYVINNVYGKAHHKHSLDEYMARLEPIYDTLKTNVSFRNPFILTGILFLLVSLALLYSYIRFPAMSRFFIFAFLIISMSELLIFNSRCKIMTNTEPLATFKAESPIADFISGDKDLFRVYEFVGQGIGNAEEVFEVLPNRSINYSLYDIGCYTPLVMKDYCDFIGDLGSVDDSTGSRIPDEKILRMDINLLRFLNVKYVLSASEIPFLRHVSDFGACGIYTVDNYFDRFFITDKVVFSEEGNIRGNIVNSRYASGKKPCVYVGKNREGGAGFENMKSESSEIKIRKYDAGSITLDVSNEPGSAVLATSELYYPGWKVFINGKEAELLKVNSLFRGVLLPEGRSKVEMVYRPRLFYVFLAISFLWYLLCFVFCIYSEKGIEGSLIWASCVFAVFVFILFFCVFLYSQAGGKL
ncbi:MAG: YfhO family protein, partial [Candidatus Aureabacteria bacterium]|nr:YfhO family protein [Candidatus Auribacterota bacterium]